VPRKAAALSTRQDDPVMRVTVVAGFLLSLGSDGGRRMGVGEPGGQAALERNLLECRGPPHVKFFGSMESVPLAVGTRKPPATSR
jgi:hypothetical protein